jgi:hypothetical protein
MVLVRHLLRFGVFALLATAAAVGGGCATESGDRSGAGQPRKDLSASDYYPLNAGWKWAYDLEKDGQKILAVYAVVERGADMAVVQSGDDRLVYAITPAGIAQKEGATVGDFVLKNPLALGNQWAVAGGTAKIVSTTQEVTVDAGHFTSCLVVEVTRSDPVRVARTTFAPEIGPVKLELQVQDGARFITPTRANLRAVTRPGEDVFR